MLTDQVRTFCQLYKLLEPGLLVVAVSGGADSLVLLHILHTLRSEFGISLHVATFDHGLRGEAGADDVRFVVDVCREWGIPVSTGRADVPALAHQWSLGIEAAARKARYAFLADTADQSGARQIATGHNRDDQAETVLMHIIRGAGLSGLRGMLPRAPLPGTQQRADPLIVVRPLLATPRAAIDAYIDAQLRTLGIEPRQDATNTDTAYTRNRIRREILPLLESINPHVRAALARTAALARDEAAALSASLPALTRTADGLTISRTAFQALLIGQQRHLLREAALQLVPDAELSADRIEGVVTLINQRDHGARARLGGDVWVTLTRWEAGGTVLIADESRYPDGCPWLLPGASLALDLPISGAGVFPLPGSQWRLTVERANGPEVPDNALSAVLSIPADARLELRTRAQADRFRPRGAEGHSQKLSDTLINMKVHAAWRDRIPLLTINDEIGWFVVPLANGPRVRLSDTVTGQGGDLWKFAFSSP